MYKKTNYSCHHCYQCYYYYNYYYQSLFNKPIFPNVLKPVQSKLRFYKLQICYRRDAFLLSDKKHCSTLGLEQLYN